MDVAVARLWAQANAHADDDARLVLLLQGLLSTLVPDKAFDEIKGQLSRVEYRALREQHLKKLETDDEMMSKPSIQCVPLLPRSAAGSLTQPTCHGMTERCAAGSTSRRSSLSRRNGPPACSPAPGSRSPRRQLAVAVARGGPCRTTVLRRGGTAAWHRARRRSTGLTLRRGRRARRRRWTACMREVRHACCLLFAARLKFERHWRAQSSWPRSRLSLRAWRARRRRVA